MSNFFTKIFKPSRKSHHRENFQPLEDYGQRGGGGSSSIKPHSTTRNEFDTGPLKSSMRRRPQTYDDEFLRVPTAAYHTSSQQHRHRCPKSLPPSRTFEDSPNASPSSSTDGGGGGYEMERSFHSEFIPSTQKHQPSTSSHRRSKKHRIPSTDFGRDERHKRYFVEESDSQNEEIDHAMKQIKKYKNLLRDEMEKNRRLKSDNEKLMTENHHISILNMNKDGKIQQLESEIAQLSQEKRSLELENQHLKSMGYSYGGMPMRYSNYPPAYPQMPPPPSHFAYLTPPSGLRNREHFNNTNTGSVMASGSSNPHRTGTAAAPSHHHQHQHHPVENLFGEGSGEQLAFLSANTTASQALLPGMPAIPSNDEISDEVKVFRKMDESSPSRPPTNSNQSLILSTGIGGSNSTGSSPPTNANKTNEQTPVASIKKETSPKISNPKIDAFNEIISKQLNALTPKSSKIAMKKTKSLSTMDEIVVNFNTAINLNH